MRTALPTEDVAPIPKGGNALTYGERLGRKPLFLLATTAGTIFIAEMAVMFVLQFLPELHAFRQAVVDAVLLSVTVFPSLYWFVLKPLNQHVARTQQAETDKDAVITQLHQALDEVKTLRGIVPICAACKKIRDDKGFWHQVEVYVAAHSDAMFTHGICHECAERLYPGIKISRHAAAESGRAAASDSQMES